MAHAPVKIDEVDKTPIGASLAPAKLIALVAVAIGAVLLLTGFFGDRMLLVGGGFKRIMFAYLIGYCFILALTVGSLALVLLTTLFRAGWVVAVRRVPETFAANFLFVGLLGLPILFVALFGNGMVYPWSMNAKTVATELHEAEEFLHHLHAEHGSHDVEHHKGDGTSEDQEHAAADTATDPFYVSTQANQQYAAAAPAGGHDEYAEHSYDPADPGMAYPEDRELADKIQEANYWTLLAYMLDYKRFSGNLEYVHVDPDTKAETVYVSKDDLKEAGKGFAWYSPLAFAFRVVVYLTIFTAMGMYYWKKSIAQDATGDPELTTKREWWAPPLTVLFALTVTFCSFDLLMSLDPAWYSTMFGVIYFANAFLAGIALTILVCLALQKRGWLKIVNVEHYHDLGKLLFAMTFFWGYTSFSQFMLIWYASLPETTYWFELRGATTVKTAPQYGTAWSWLILLLLFGHLLVPFGFLLSRHVKRNLTCLAIASVWLLLMVYLDLFWYIMPVYESPGFTLGLPELGAVLALGGAVAYWFLKRFADHSPVAYNDPRMHESAGLDTTAWAPIYQ